MNLDFFFPFDSAWVQNSRLILEPECKKKKKKAKKPQKT